MNSKFLRLAGLAAALLAGASVQAQSLLPKNPGAAGLWVGEVTLSEVTHARGNTNAPVVNKAQLRLILHVGADGTVRLLRDVTVARKDSTVDSTPPGVTFPPSAVILVTDHTRLPGLTGVIRRNGKMVGQRFATAAYDFARPASDKTLTGNELNLDGGLGQGFVCSGRLEIPTNHPTNPFKHRYHPDHAQGLALTRDLKITMTKPATNLNGVDQLTGDYEETIAGLAKSALKTRGTVVLNRLSPVAFLNQ